MKGKISVLFLFILASNYTFSQTLQTVTDNGDTTSNMIKITGTNKVGAGTGLELFYMNNTSYISSYNRTAAVFQPLVLSASLFNLATGNVGINTLTPAYKLDVNGTANFSGIMRTPASFRVVKDGSASSLESIALYNAAQTRGANIQLGATPNPTLDFWSTSTAGIWTKRAYFDSIGNYIVIGNTGIGQSSPAYKLDVNGTGNFNGIVRSTASFRVIKDGSNTSLETIAMYNTAQTRGANIQLGATPNPALKFFSTNPSGVYTERMTIDSAGNVGIGTVAPTQKMEVNGSIASSAASTTGNTPVTNINSLPGFRINGNIGNNAENGFTYQSGSGGGAAIGFYRGASFNTGIDFYTNTYGNSGAGSTIHRMRLTENGYLGIGTANPQSMLAVNGDITAKKIKVTSTGWSDYVFDSAYQLAPLHQVAKYIQHNKHLPDVPSAVTVKNEGIDVGDTQALLLKKIEELTLYIIEQDKALKEMKQEIKELKVSK